MKLRLMSNPLEHPTQQKKLYPLRTNNKRSLARHRIEFDQVRVIGWGNRIKHEYSKRRDHKQQVSRRGRIATSYGTNAHQLWRKYGRAVQDL